MTEQVYCYTRSGPDITAAVDAIMEPIIGVWRYRPSTGYDIRDRFNADGTWAYSIYSDSTGIINFDGRWITQGDNSYTVRQSVTGSKRTYKYNPAQNTIYDVEYPTMIKIPYQGDVVIDPYDSTL